jgi:hypothetical protein
MEEQEPITPAEAKGCLLRGCALSGAVLLLLAVLIVLPAMSRSMYGPLVLGEGSRERDNVTALATSIEAYRTQFGRYPISDEEWRSFEANADVLLDAGKTSVEPRYRIRWDALGDSSSVIIMSPNRDLSKSDVVMFPWHRRSGQNDADFKGYCRFLMLGDGTVTYGPNIEWEKKREFAEWAGWSFKEEPPKE